MRTRRNAEHGEVALVPADQARPGEGAEPSFNIFSASQIGDSNKRRVLQMLFDLGPTSRAELARLTGTKRTTITGIVQPLIDGGIIVEEAPQKVGGVGKPARPLWFSSVSAPVCAIVLRSDKVESALVTLPGEMRAYSEVRLPPEERTRESYLRAVRASIERSLKANEGKPLGIGVAVAGMVDPDEGTVVKMNLAPSLAGLPLRDVLQEEFGLKTVIDHHPRAILLGERWFGEGRGLRNFAVIYADEVLGCSMYLDGAPLRGPHGSGGELGHTVVDIGGRICTCGKRGCWETVATISWMRSKAAEAGLDLGKEPDPAKLVELSHQNAAAAALLDDYAYNLAVGMANLQTLLMPDTFILYGQATRGGEPLRELIASRLGELALAVPGGDLRVLMGRNEAETTLRGAAGLVISDELDIEY